MIYKLHGLTGGHGLKVRQVLHVVPHTKAGLGKKSGQKQKAVYSNDFIISIGSPKILKKGTLKKVEQKLKSHLCRSPG